ncbi:MAG TPA: hypothetical protein VIF09_18370 [Polyangiaceae bacterium]|jgi:hypothetical protein
MTRALRVAHLATLAALTWTTAAAAGGSRVVIVRDRGTDAVLGRAGVRLAAELRAAGFEVEERVVDAEDDARRAVEDPDADGPFATVLLRRSGARAATDVWVADHVTHKTVVRRLGARGTGDAGDRSLALRVVELMRASLVEGVVLPQTEDEPPAPTPSPAAGAPSGRPAPPPPPPSDVLAWTRDAIREPSAGRTAHVGVAVGVAGLFAGPDVGLAVAPELRVAWRATPAWSIGGVVAGPGFGGRVTGTQGNANIRQELALAEVALEPPTSGPLSALLALGAGAYHFEATGNAAVPFTSGQQGAWSALLAGGADARLRVSAAASIVLEVRELFTLPRPVVAFAGQRVATSMHPGTLGSLSLAVDL